MQRQLKDAAALAATVAALMLACGPPAAAENWVEAGNSKLGGKDFPFCIDVDDIRHEADGWTSFLAVPCDLQWRKLLADAAARRAVRCDRPISEAAPSKEFRKSGWSPEAPMGAGVSVLATFACKRK
jgi:hypothetical protein